MDNENIEIKIINFKNNLEKGGNNEYLELFKISGKSLEVIMVYNLYNENDDPLNYIHQIDGAGIKHCMKGHPDLNDTDFFRIPEILINPDSVEYAGITDSGIHALKYKKAFNGTTYYVEEVRTGRGKLSLKTMYKTNTPKSA